MVHTTHPGNIGAVARVMKNMCLSRLYLVKPKLFPHEEATARSSGATDILEQAVVCETLDEAIADCALVVGTSARERSVEWPVHTPRESAELMRDASADRQVALLMGRESSGLTNDELNRCQYLVHIPANAEYSSLNVAMAVQVLAYEMLVAFRSATSSTAGTPPASLTAEEMERFYAHLEQALRDTGFTRNPQQTTKLMSRLRRFFFRANPDAEEMNILRGILSAAQGKKQPRSTKT